MANVKARTVVRRIIDGLLYSKDVDLRVQEEHDRFAVLDFSARDGLQSVFESQFKDFNVFVFGVVAASAPRPLAPVILGDGKLDLCGRGRLGTTVRLRGSRSCTNTAGHCTMSKQPLWWLKAVSGTAVSLRSLKAAESSTRFVIVGLVRSSQATRLGDLTIG